MCDQLSARPDVNWAAGVGHTGLLDLMLFLVTSLRPFGMGGSPRDDCFDFFFFLISVVMDEERDWSSASGG